ncbi:MAG: diaminopimelate epimerase [Candidatus Margulisbacteria bacterium]|nr:diaminopimelate epimerase [Candidatus Margulisiibacteriota bacterium]
MNFTKMQGTGNDFVLLNAFKEKIKEKEYSSLAQKMCDRHFGVGADGIILALPSDKEDIRMRIFNADGSEAEMCGNGIRCFALFVKNEGLISQNKFNVETLAGKIIPEIIELTGTTKAMVKVDMGTPFLEAKDIPVNLKGKGPFLKQVLQIDNQSIEYTPIGMGNPHCIVFVDKITDKMVHQTGPIIENNTNLFPKKTNVEFLKINSKNKAEMRVWERGSGETLACGTGTCASVVAGILNGYLNNTVTVQLLGGELIINWEQGKSVLMTGPAEVVFKGIY